MAGHSRPKDGVASLAYVPAIHAIFRAKQGVDARHKAGHDVANSELQKSLGIAGEYRILLGLRNLQRVHRSDRVPD